jgi:toxin ParE1/3/4
LSKQLTFSAQAEKDLREIVRYTRQQWGNDQARRYRQELELALKKLSLNAQLGRQRDEVEPGLRSFKTASHIAFYREKDAGISVLRVMHPSQDIERAFDRRMEQDKDRER